MMPPLSRRLPAMLMAKLGSQQSLAREALQAHKGLFSKWCLQTQLPQVGQAGTGGIGYSYSLSPVLKGPQLLSMPRLPLGPSKAWAAVGAVLTALGPGGPHCLNSNASCMLSSWEVWGNCLIFLSLTFLPAKWG